MPTALPHALHDKVAESGFVVIRGFLSEDEINEYREASKKAIELSRSGKWPHVRTRGKQFPPWPKNFSPDIWGISGLLHPDWPPELADKFQQLYASDKLLDASSDILQTSRDNLVMELLNMLINPLTDFGLDWHRDDVRPEASAEEELEKLSIPDGGTQFNLALYPDECLIVVPGSHKRARTEHERTVTTTGTRKDPIDGQLVVKLGAGDCAFYNNNILHRATYDSSVERITLHGSYGHAIDGKSRALNILQFGQKDWLPRFQPKDPALQKLRAHLQVLIDENKDSQSSYSLEG